MKATKRSKVVFSVLLLVAGVAAFIIGVRAAREANNNGQRAAQEARQLPKIKNLTKSLEVVKAELLDQDTLLLSLRNVSGQEVGAYTLQLGTQFVTTHGSANTRHTTAISPGEVVTDKVGLDALRPNDDVKIVAAEVGDSYEGDEDGILTTKVVRERLKQTGKGKNK